METDRPLEIGNLRKKIAWGENCPQIANRPCSVKGDMALTDAKGGYGPNRRKPRMCPLETKLGAWTRCWGVGRGVGGLDKHSGAWIRILDLGLEIWTLDKEFGGLDK